MSSQRRLVPQARISLGAAGLAAALLLACAGGSAVASSPPMGAAAACKAAWQPGLVQLPVTSAGRQRPVAFYVPARLAAGKPAALVLDLHGSGGNAEGQAAQSQLRRVADAEGFLVANPEGGVRLPASEHGRFWNIPGVPLVNGTATPADAPDDVQYIADVIDAVAAATCLDSTRVYVTGMSGGGRMSSLLACRLADRVAAFAPVAGLRAGIGSTEGDRAPPPAACRPARPVPILTFHGTDDHTNAYDGDADIRWGYSVPVAVQRWVALDGCRGEPVRDRVSPHVMRESWRACGGDAEVVFYRTEATEAEGGGHVWPTGPAGPAPGTPSRLERGHEINASRIIWEFFGRHRLPPGP
jgi:polyhydroxybutyrate depolymerase